MKLLSIDPGDKRSAWLVYDGMPIDYGIADNEFLIDTIDGWDHDHLAIEYMKPRGMPTSANEMDAQFWAGRIVQASRRSWSKVYRSDVKMHICHNARANDSNIRAALIDMYGGKEKAIGGVKCPTCKGKGWRGVGRPTCVECGGLCWLHPPGHLHGVTEDVWSALAIAITWWDTIRPQLERAMA